MSFKAIKFAVIDALRSGNYQNVARSDINVKNLLATGQISAASVVGILGNCTSAHMTTTPHDDDASVDVHVVVKNGWYIKFFFLDPDTFFISVHQ